MFKEEMININRKPIPKRTKEQINELTVNLLSKMTLKEKSFVSQRKSQRGCFRPAAFRFFFSS